MRSYLRLKLYTLTIFLIFSISAMYIVPAYADDETPPVEPPAATEPSEPPAQDSVTEEAPNPTPLEVAPVAEESQPAESVESILAEVPQDTQIIILNEDGDAIPLAADAAAQAILDGDPMWCPAGVTPGGMGCTGTTTSFATMLTNLTGLYGAAGPGQAGVIWIEGDYDSSVHDTAITNFTLNGNNLTNMKDFALTIQGGWTGTGKTVNTNNPSEFVGATLNILNWQNAVTLNDIVIRNGTSGASYALVVTTTGNINAAHVVIKNNTESGAGLDNAGGIGNVAVTDSEFSDNSGSSGGLVIFSNGTVTLKNVTANNNGTGPGIYILNHTASSAKNVTLTNITANSNNSDGLFVNSKGLITVTDLTVISNGNHGSSFTNTAGTAGVTLNGTNLFFSNNNQGLNISSNGAVKLNNINAVDNTQSGALIDNTGGVNQPVTLTGTNSFKFNGGAGLVVTSLGQITGNNITATSNISSMGASLDNHNGPATSGITLTGINTFSDNNSYGLYILSAGAVTLNSITANSNGTGGFGPGTTIDNTYGSLFKSVTLTGTNTFNFNKDEGLDIKSDGIVTLNNLNASNNSGNYAVVINNTTSMPATPKAVNLNGTNIINNNKFGGLTITTHGAITTNNLTVNFNGIVGGGGYGAFFDNHVSGATLTPTNVTMNGVNSFSGNYSDGLYIISQGVIKANAVTANDSTNGGGATLNNNQGASTNSIILTGTNTFSGNNQTNLSVYSYGVISLNNVTASNSVANQGAIIDNSASSTPKTVTLTGTNSFSGNWYGGVSITTRGAITINNLSANGNGTSASSGPGAYLSNSYLGSTAGVTLTGNNSFNGNYGTGLFIGTLGIIKTNNLTANGSIASYGAYLDNTSSALPGITLAGTNSFSNNKFSNLEIYTNGAITINSLTASGSATGSGAYITHGAGALVAPKPFVLTGANLFNGNSGDGLYVNVYGTITTSNLSAAGNGTSGIGAGVFLSNEAAPTPAGITLNGTNVFSGNDDANLIVRSKGNITSNNITANGSNGFGAGFNTGDFAGSIGNVTLTGINTFNGNSNNGLSIGSKGSVTINNITASNNAGIGVSIDNTPSTLALPKAVTILGYLTANNNTSNSNGLQIYTYGAVVTNNITTSGNGGSGVFIDNNYPSQTIPSNITMNGINTFIGNNNTGLYIDTLGSVITNNVTSSDSANGYGVEIYASDPNAIGTVTLKGNNTLNGNNNTNLYIDTQGAISLNNIIASDSSVAGAYINNAYSGAKPFTLSGTNIFNNNANGNGLQVFSNGVITTNNLTANNNGTIGGSGVILDNDTAVVAAAVILKGINTVNGNYGGGLEVHSLGSITVNSITANYTVASGSVFLDNHLGATTATVTVTGVNNFLENAFDGLNIWSKGLVTLSKVVADGNGDDGLSVTTTGNITLTCGSFINNAVNGVILVTPGNATLAGVIAAGNGTNINTVGVTGLIVNKHGCPLP